MPLRWLASRFKLRQPSLSPILSSTRHPSWSSEEITDQWFRDHFQYAASVIHEWLQHEMPIAGSTLLDFGCGDGITDLGFALKYQPEKMIGVDITSTFTQLGQTAANQIGLKKLPENLDFRSISAGQPLAGKTGIDAIFSWSTFEHIERPYLNRVIADLFRLLRPGGLFFVQIEPLYYSPNGSHLGRFVKEPWAHLLWEEVVLKKAVLDCAGDIPASEKEFNFFARSFEDYKAFIYEEFLKLNKLTAGELVGLFQDHGFRKIREERFKVALPAPANLRSEERRVGKECRS